MGKTTGAKKKTKKKTQSLGKTSGADYNIFLSPKSNSEKHRSKGGNDYEINGADYNAFLSKQRNFGKFGVEKSRK